MSERVTIEEYFMGRDLAYPEECTLDIQRNAVHLLESVNALLEFAAMQKIEPLAGQNGYVASGWRPPAVNDKTSNAAKASAHLLGLAVDLRDHADRSLARWCLRNLDRLEGLGLYMEDPRWTPNWVHLQVRAPGSGKRVYVPSTAPALALALPEQALA